MNPDLRGRDLTSEMKTQGKLARNLLLFAGVPTLLAVEWIRRQLDLPVVVNFIAFWLVVGVASLLAYRCPGGHWMRWGYITTGGACTVCGAVILDAEFIRGRHRVFFVLVAVIITMALSIFTVVATG